MDSTQLGSTEIDDLRESLRCLTVVLARLDMSQARVVADESPPRSSASPEVVTRSDADWFRDKGITVSPGRLTTAADAVLDEIAADVGRQANQVAPLLSACRRGSALGRSQVVHLRDEPPEASAAITRLASRFHEVGLLSFMRHDRPSEQLMLRVADAGVPLLGGGWLERWAAVRCVRIADRVNREVSVMRNVELEGRSGRPAELDVCLVPEGAEPIIVECRTGSYQELLARADSLRRSLRLPSDRFLVLLNDVNPTVAAELTAIHSLTVVTAGTFEQRIEDLLTDRPERDRPARATTCEDDSATDEEVERIRSLLRSHGVRPRGTERRAVLEALAVECSGGGRTLADVRAAVADRAAVSRGAAADVIRAVRGGGGVVREAPGVSGDRARIGPLVTADVPQLELCCLRGWRAIISSVDPTLLAAPRMEQAFLRAVDAT